MVNGSKRTKLSVAAAVAVLLLGILNILAAYVWGVLCFARRGTHMAVASAADDEWDDTQAAFLMVGATEREARSMHPFAAGLD